MGNWLPKKHEWNWLSAVMTMQFRIKGILARDTA
jgi:hypothetical protein